MQPKSISRRNFLKAMVATTALSAVDWPGIQALTSSIGRKSDIADVNEHLDLMASVCDYLAHRTWGPWKNFNPLEKLHNNGVEWCRAWVLTTNSPDLDRPYEEWEYLGWKDEYWSCREYTGQILKEAAKLGMGLDLVFFLSDKPAAASWQPAPKGWGNYTVEETADALESSCYEIANYYKNQGLAIELYEIGNEIGDGLCGFYPGPDGRIPYPEGVDKFSPEGVLWWRKNVWNIEAALLKRAIKGVKRVNPDARILLHTDEVNVHPDIGGSAWSKDNLFSKGFFQSMVEYGVEFNYAGLSYYPTINFIPGNDFNPIFDEISELIDSIAATTGKQIYVSEFSYSGNIPGYYYERPNYPFTEKGQANCVADFLQWMKSNTNVKSVAYWYPDRFPGMSMEAPREDSYGLFSSDFKIRPGLLEFKKVSLNIVPGPPRGLGYVDTNGQIQINWKPSSGAKGYKIYYDDDLNNPPYDGLDAVEGPSPLDVGNVTSKSLTGLKTGKTYKVALTAYNHTGESRYSIEVSVTPGGLPGAPTEVTATAANAQATVSFTPPVSGDGSPIISYKVTSSPGGKTATGKSSPITVKGLTNGTAYTFKVRATNAVGSSPASSKSNSVTPVGPPKAPKEVTATAANAQATVSFTPPVSDGGSPITSYRVTSSPGGKTATGKSSPITVKGLTNGTAYTFKVRATNTIGTGPASSPSNSVTPIK